MILQHVPGRPPLGLPDVGPGGCCLGAGMHGADGCTCWVPEYDLEQQPIRPGLPVPPAPLEMCGVGDGDDGLRLPADVAGAARRPFVRVRRRPADRARRVRNAVLLPSGDTPAGAVAASDRRGDRRPRQRVRSADSGWGAVQGGWVAGDAVRGVAAAACQDDAVGRLGIERSPRPRRCRGGGINFRIATLAKLTRRNEAYSGGVHTGRSS
jgi:hypothetical protein